MIPLDRLFDLFSTVEQLITFGGPGPWMLLTLIAGLLGLLMGLVAARDDRRRLAALALVLGLVALGCGLAGEQAGRAELGQVRANLSQKLAEETLHTPMAAEDIQRLDDYVESTVIILRVAGLWALLPGLLLGGCTLVIGRQKRPKWAETA